MTDNLKMTGSTVSLMVLSFLAAYIFFFYTRHPPDIAMLSSGYTHTYWEGRILVEVKDRNFEKVESALNRIKESSDSATEYLSLNISSVREIDTTSNDAQSFYEIGTSAVYLSSAAINNLQTDFVAALILHESFHGYALRLGAIDNSGPGYLILPGLNDESDTLLAQEVAADSFAISFLMQAGTDTSIVEEFMHSYTGNLRKLMDVGSIPPIPPIF